MKYALLIYVTEQERQASPPGDVQSMYEEYAKFSADLVRLDAMRGGEELQPVATATTVRVQDGETVVTDGPFAETKEQLGGFYLIECADMDEAIAWAAKVPSSRYGSIEVRPVVEQSGGSHPDAPS
jgi:hypothetical protein